METIKDEIKSAIKSLNLSDIDFRCLPDPEAELLFKTFIAHYVDKDRRWWWEGFTRPSVRAQIPQGMAFKKISNLVPSPSEKVWFVAEDDQLPFYTVFDAPPRLIQAVIGECYGFEYYLISKDLSWLLCENHHDTLIGVGEPITNRLLEMQLEMKRSRD